TELPIDHTRLEAPADADAILLLSDGRFTAPSDLPPVYPVIDPALDAVNDGQITDMTAVQGRVIVTAHVRGGERRLHVTGASVQPTDMSAGEPVAIGQIDPGAKRIVAELDPADAWPENDRMAIAPLPDVPTERWAIGLTVPGLVSMSAADCPTDVADYLPAACVVLATDAPLSDRAAATLAAYVDQLGGTLLCVGPARRLPPVLRQIVPMTSEPPTARRRWTLLLDASGSMAATDAAGSTRWSVMVQAAEHAVARLPANDWVTVMTFARSTEPIITDATPDAAQRALQAIAPREPAGPTGLAAALDSIAASTGAADTRVLLVSDGDAPLPEAPALAQRLNAARVNVFALTTSPSAPVAALAKATGGEQLVREAPADWAAAMDTLSQAGDDTGVRSVTSPGRDALAGLSVRMDEATHGYVKASVQLLAGDAEWPLIATWQSGAGHAVSLVGRPDRDGLLQVVQRLEQRPVDPRFEARWDAATSRVQITAADATGPLNGLVITLVCGGESIAFDQAAPGQYEAPTPRQAEPSLAVVRLGGRVIARHMLAGRCARDFDDLGNDRGALQALATRTGGAVIGPGNVSPIAFDFVREVRSLTGLWAGAGFACVLGAVGCWVRRR
ncbi:MAG: VWA domain-containing protein, partial [Tepidisphaeraceae bacterium]